MVGVSNHLFEAGGASRFFGGFALGHVVASLVLALILLPLASLVSWAPSTARLVAACLVATVFGALDVWGRTPFLWRQVPQRFSLVLPVGRLGMVYGVDVGLLFTTQKATSLLWVALAGSVLTGSSSIVLATLGSIAVLYVVTTWILSRAGQDSLTAFRFWGASETSWKRVAQVISASASFAAGFLILTEAWWW